jgi:hypothetical protein
MQKPVVLIRAFTQALPLIQKFVVAIGIGLTLASLRLDIFTSLESLDITYWSNWTTRVLLVALIAVCAGLLIVNVIRDEGDRFLASVCGVGAILLGYFLFIPVAGGFDNLGKLALGPKLAVLGSALIVLGALPLRALGSWQRSRERSGRPLYVAWLIAAIAPVLVIVSLNLNTVTPTVALSNSTGATGAAPRYWHSAGFAGNHDLGIFMLVLAVVAIAMAIGGAVLKAHVLGRWALAASLLLLGLTLYYPSQLAFRRLGSIASGGGLALEGSVLAVVAALAAVSAGRGAVDLRKLPIPRLLAASGVGLALAATWANVWGEQGSSFWANDGTLGGFPFILVVLGGVLLATSFVFGYRWLLPSVSILGWLLVGYFGFFVAQNAPSDLNTLGPAAWLGICGGALMGLSIVSLRSMVAWKRRSPSMTLRRFIPWLAVAIGTAIVLSSLWLTTEELPFGLVRSYSYWNIAGDHSIGVVMLVLGASTLVALVGVLITRLSVLSTWAQAASLALLGISVFIPALVAFNQLGRLRSGGWLALVGSLLASAGAVAMTLPEQLLWQAEPEEAVDAASSRARTPLKGKKQRVPEMRRTK